jgi:hypothetical protein
LCFVFTLKSKFDFHAFTYRIMIFHGSRCTRDHVFTSIFSVFHVSRFRKKAIHVSRLYPFQTHSIGRAYRHIVSDQGHHVGNDIAIWLYWLQAFIGKHVFVTTVSTVTPPGVNVVHWVLIRRWRRNMSLFRPLLLFRSFPHHLLRTISLFGSPRTFIDNPFHLGCISRWRN